MSEIYGFVAIPVVNEAQQVMGLGVSDWIQIGAIIISTLISIISIGIAVATLRQTNKITKEANRPYLVATLEYTAFGGIKNYYLVIRNCGNTAATINSIICSRAVDFLCGLDLFNNLQNTSIAPHQSITTMCAFEDNWDEFSLTLSYNQDKDTYEEIFNINPTAVANIIYGNKTRVNMDLPEAIVNSTNELIRSRL